jgi:branched-chain amino acid transport system permease protein
LNRSALTVERALWWGPALALVLILAFAPLLFTDFYLSQVITKALWLGIAAASLIFLAAYVGMVSLGQVALYGIAGFTMANLAAADGGSPIAWSPWAATLVGILAAVGAGLFIGAIASRSYGIYFLMITLVFSVIANLFFGQVTSVSGFGGISGIPIPDFFDRTAHPDRLYFATLLVAALVYAGLRYVARTPFGLALQGIRDDPVRMRSLGYRVTLHRLLAFGLAGFVAAVGGILFVWWNAQIAPSTIDLTATIDVLLIAVIGGMFRLEGAWVGALVFVLINNYAQDVGFVAERFHTLIGLIFLVIVLVSPDGLVGLWERTVGRLRGPSSPGETTGEGGSAGAVPAGERGASTLTGS